MSFQSEQARAVRVIAEARDLLRCEAITARGDAARANARGFVVLAADLRALANRIERLAGRLDEALTAGVRP